MKNSAAFTLKIITFAGMAALTACGGIYNNYDTNNPDPVDRPAELNRKDFTDSMLPKTKKVTDKIELKEPSLPKVSDVLTAPKAPKIGSDKVITISVTDDIQLKDVFLELSRLAEIDIEVDPSIQGGVIFKATDKPISEVVDRITDLAGLRYSVNGGVLRIERDTPYLANYPVGFLNMTRSNSGSMTVNTSVLSGSSGGDSEGGSGGSSSGSSGSGSSGGDSEGGGSLTSGSENSLENSSESDLWTNVLENLTTIIDATPVPAGRVQASNPESKSFVSMNRQAGMVSVMATGRNHQKVKAYLEQVKEYASSQVLIEAKVIEVSLNDAFQSGVDWSFLSDAGNGLQINTNIPSTSPLSNIVSFNLSRDNGNIETAVQLAETFGTLRTLSSPRVLVVNNQQAVLSFATNQIYYTLDITQTPALVENTAPTVTVDSTLNTIPIGVILTLQPAINLKNQEIMMNIRPTLSRLTGNRVSDPAVAFLAAQNDLGDIVSEVPEVEVREMDSVLKLQSGEIMAIGGMIEQRNENNDKGLPYVSELPLIGNAFKNVQKSNRAVQTVIFLKATIVPSYGVDEQDQKFYNMFETDPRPFKF